MNHIRVKTPLTFQIWKAIGGDGFPIGGDREFTVCPEWNCQHLSLIWWPSPNHISSLFLWALLRGSLCFDRVSGQWGLSIVLKEREGRGFQVSTSSWLPRSCSAWAFSLRISGLSYYVWCNTPLYIPLVGCMQRWTLGAPSLWRRVGGTGSNGEGTVGG